MEKSNINFDNLRNLFLDVKQQDWYELEKGVKSNSIGLLCEIKNSQLKAWGYAVDEIFSDYADVPTLLFLNKRDTDLLQGAARNIAQEFGGKFSPQDLSSILVVTNDLHFYFSASMRNIISYYGNRDMQIGVYSFADNTLTKYFPEDLAPLRYNGEYVQDLSTADPDQLTLIRVVREECREKGLPQTMVLQGINESGSLVTRSFECDYRTSSAVQVFEGTKEKLRVQHILYYGTNEDFHPSYQEFVDMKYIDADEVRLSFVLDNPLQRTIVSLNLEQALPYAPTKAQLQQVIATENEQKRRGHSIQARL